MRAANACPLSAHHRPILSCLHQHIRSTLSLSSPEPRSSVPFDDASTFEPVPSPHPSPPVKRGPGRPRRQARFSYDPLDLRSPEVLRRLGERSLVREISLLRLRIAELQSGPDPDWDQTLRTLGVLVRLLRAEQVNPETDSESLDALREFGRQVERAFAPDPPPGGEFHPKND